MTDATDKKSLSNKNVVIMIVFLLGLSISSTHFVTKNLSATPHLISSSEKRIIMSHVDNGMKKALEHQKIYLMQQAFNDKILESLSRQNARIDEMKKEIARRHP